MMAREILGKVGLGYTYCEVAFVSAPQPTPCVGRGAVFLEAGKRDRAEKPKVAVWLDESEIDSLILHLKEGKRRLTKVNAVVE